MALPGEKPVQPKYKPPDETSRIYTRYPVIKMEDIPPTISKVPKEEPKPTPEEPMPDYLAPAEAHREELRRQAEMESLKETPISEYREVSFKPTIVYDPLADLDGVPTTYTYTEEERERSRKAFKELGEEIWFQDPRVKGVVREVTKPIKEYDPKEFSVAWGLKKTIEAEEKLFRDVKSKIEVGVGRTRSKAEKAKLKDEDILAGLLYSKATALSLAKSTIGVTSYFVRPKRIVETPSDVFKFITDPGAQALALQQIVGDPASAVTGVGGALLGISIVSGVSSEIQTLLKGKKVKSVPYTREVTRLTGRPGITRKTKIKSGYEPEAPPMYIKMKGEWFRTGESVLDYADPYMTLQTVDEVFKLKDVKAPFTLYQRHIGYRRPTISTKTVTTLKQVVGPRTSRLGTIGLLGVLKSEQELVDATMREIVKIEDYLWDRPDYLPEQRQPSKTVETPDTAQLITPKYIEEEMQKVFPEYRQKPRDKHRTIEQELQRELQKDVQDLDRQLRQYDIEMKKSTFKFDRPLTRKEERRGRKGFEEMWGETRKYPLARRKAFFKKLLGGLI